MRILMRTDILSFSGSRKLRWLCELLFLLFRSSTELEALAAMATVCRANPSATVAIQQSQSCVQSSSSARQLALRIPVTFSGVRVERSKRSMVVRMGIRAVESFDAAFQLTAESDQLLRSMLVSESFTKQVARDCALSEDVKPEFSGEIFQPVPWSQTTKHGMLPEYEKYHHDKENYVIVNVPPQIMFKAKIFKPSRLCAIYQKVSSSS